LAKIRSHKRSPAPDPSVEPEPCPGFRRAFDDEGREIVVETIGMRPHPARFRLLESEGEGVETLCVPNQKKFVASGLDVDPEMHGIKRCGIAAVGAVGAIHRS
jgi:hypothetical protein